MVRLVEALALVLALLSLIAGALQWQWGIAVVLPYAALAVALGSLALTAHTHRRRFGE